MDMHPQVDAQGSSDLNSTDLPDVDAAHVYVMMKKNTRVSRNIRACWFFRHLGRQVSFTPLISVENLTEELNLVSVIPKNPEMKLLLGQTYQVSVGPDTIVTFLSYQYKLSFTLDLSPSMMTVDIQNASYVYDGILTSLSRCLRGLVMPLYIPGSCIHYSPDLYISVICHTPVVCSFTNQVLVQGVKINQSNVDHYLKHIEFELNQFEAALSSSFVSLLKLYKRKESFFLDEDEEEDRERQFNLTDHIGTPEAGFTNMLRYGILSLQLLPENSSSGIIIITDGIVGLPNSYLIELLLNQMRNNTTMCSFIKVGSPSSLYRKLAHVPHIELMQAIATATFGAYLGTGPDVSEEKGEANLYHRAILFWSFQRGLEGFKYDITHFSDEDMPGSISWIKRMLNRHPITKESYGAECLRKEREKRTVVAGLHSVLSVRLREGYTIKSVAFKKDNTEIHVKLHFPWRDYGKIEYAASAPWPLNYSSSITTIEVTVEGSYDLLHEMLCKGNKEVKSNLRLNNIKTLWTILERISSTDKMLEHLQSFSSEPVYYQTPESIRSGVPLFYIQPDGPSINTQLKASTPEKFAVFWKAVIQLDTNNWQKWLHSHRIGLVLEHDRQFPKCFQVPNASSRFSSIQCRQTLASLSLLLREWSTFVLAENHSYIKFLVQEQDKPPKFFCVLRLTSKAPNMIIRLGFLGGTPASIRLEELRILREKIRDLCFPQRGTQKTQKMSISSAPGGLDKVVKPHKSPLNREGSEIACCVLLRKPVEKILVVYESKPSDMTVVKEAPKDLTTRKLQDPMRSVFRTLTHYLQHQRWVWNIQANTKSTLSMTAIGRMLATITKLRLQEGFHFAVSNAGVTNLVLEVDMKESEEASEDDSSNIHACVVQYIIFPPHTRSTDDSLSEDDRDDTETTEADGEVQIVTECWVEPQYGVCCNNTPERQHFNGLTYLDIAKTFFPYDYECVSSLTTFEHLMYMCDNSALPSPDLLASRQSSPPSTPGHRFSGRREESFRSEPTVNFIPFPFDLLSVLPRSQQAELLFSTFVIGEASSRSEESHEDIKKPNEILLELFYDKLKDAHNKEIILSDDECNRVISHIYQRTRDPKVNPIPFSYIPQGFSSSGNSFVFEPGVLSETDTTDASSTSVKRSSGSRFLKSPDPGVQAKERQGLDQQNQFYPKKFAEKEPNKSAATKGNAQSETGHCPMWKCYVKKDVTADHLLITFVPASYDDLLLLNQVTRAVTSQEDVSSDNLSHHPHEHSDVKDHSKVSVHPSSTSPDKSKINHPAISLTRTSEHSDQIEEVQLNLMSSNIKSHTNACGSLHLPIYVYSCQLKNVTNSLVNRWSFNLPDDIFEDLTFLQETLDEGKSPRSPRGQFLSFDQPADEMNDKDSWRSSLDRRSTDSNSFRLESFKEHCKLVTDIYLNSFVLAVFRSLQHNYFVDSVDVDAAINNICEELHPLETDMTSYLQATCSHLHQLVEKARSREKYSTESGQRSGSISSYHKQQAVRFLEFDLHKEEEAPKLPEVLQLPQQAIEITEEKWASLVPEQCIQIKENHKLTELIRSRFTEAIEKCLRPVPSLPDFYFYYPNNEQLESEDDMEDKEEFDVNEEDNADDTQDLVDIIIPMNEVISGGSSLESNIDDTSFDCNISNISIERDPMPLFVHFTCTIKQKSDFQHISLQSVPQCFGEITKGLPEPIHTIDFSDFKVTFDINCLTLLNEIDQPTPRKPSYRRLLSNISQTSASGKDDADEKLSALVGSPKPLGDPVSHLPKPQHAAVYSVKDEIEYLMQEEVISSLRCMHPITADTLAFVAKYISSAAQYNSRTVMYQTVNLQFVFGAEQSLNMFIEELERQSFPGCRLTKEGDFYFLIINKTRFQNMGPLDPNRSTANSEGVIISKEERSFSLPCVFPDLADQEGVPSGSRSLVNMGEEAGGSEASENKQRPRSCSDAKVNQRTKVSLNVGSTDVKAVISLPEANAVGPTLQDLRISELDVNAEQSLKKSSSFAGLQGGRSANLTANNSRSRHCSAPSGNNTMLSRPSTMPQSPSVISSRESTTDDGFDGDVSDMELDESASMSDISGYYPELPDYWLLMQVHQDKTEVFFHSREPVDSDSAASTANKVLYSSVIKGIQSVCKKVNQALLLKELNKTKMCNSLLVPEADEDFKWTNKRPTSQRLSGDGDDLDEDDSEDGQGYLAAAMDFVPGHFNCEVVYRRYFVLPPRLKPAIQRGGNTPKGLVVLRQALNNFLVSNRKNMFVIEELSSHNVFYLRLKENQIAPESEVDLEASLADVNRQPGKSDSDTVSMASSLGHQSSRTEEVVELTVHGIENVGQEVRDDLMKMLQNKLDDALLEDICFMLRKNPQCKLKPDDIAFIQKPGQLPSTSLLLTIPGHCSMYLVALMYYLRQNLLQFLHTPNYMDSNPASQFHDIYDGVYTAIPADKVYIYVRPEKGGGKGIACVSVNLVDGQGKQVKLLNCPSPIKNNMPSLSDATEFDKYVQTTIHEKSASSRPGPTALISFNIWECGNCDLTFFSDKLILALRHSLCDIVMEYFMLTTPICSVPRNLTESFAPPVSSLPASPTKLPAETTERKHNPLTRKFSVDPPRSSTLTFSLFSSFSELRNTNSEDKVGKCLDFNSSPQSAGYMSQPRTPGGLSTQPLRPKDASLSDAQIQQQTIAKYENGEKGHLHPVFCSLAKHWMDFCCSIGVPSVYSTRLKFQSKFNVEFVLKEFQQSVMSITSDTMLRIFKVIQTSSPLQPPYGVMFTPCKTTLKEAQMNRVLETMAAGGGQITLLAIGRSAEQWQSMVLEHQDLVPNISPSAVKGYKTSQRFVPQVPDSDNRGSEQTSLRLAERDFVPRQKLLLVVCEEKQLTLYLYNWHSDLISVVEKIISRIIQWNNARAHLLDSVLAQKMGLFHHLQFSDLHYTPTQNPYTQTSAEVDSLIRYHAPPRESRRNSSISNKEKDRIMPRSTKRMIPFDQTYKNMRPPKIMGRLMCTYMSDPISRHGLQAQDIRIQSRQDKQLLHQPIQGQQSLGSTHMTSQSQQSVAQPLLGSHPPLQAQQSVGSHPPLQAQPSLGSHPPLQAQQSLGSHPPLQSQQSLGSHMPLQGQHTTGPALPRKELCEDKVPVTSINDPVFQHGLHLHEAQKSIREDEERNKLYQLYLGWLQCSGKNKANPPIMEDYLAQLKRASRLFHYCVTPLVFSPSWRQKVIQKTTGMGEKCKAEGTGCLSGLASTNISAQVSSATTPATPDKVQKTRSRHSSGTSNFSFKGKPTEEHSRKGSEAGLIGLGNIGRSKSDADEEEEPWHIALRKNFMLEYEQYLVSELSFIRFNVQPPLLKGRGQSSTLSSQGSNESPESKQWTINLQKTMTGGIIVMELSYRQEYFCVRMFTIDCSQFKVNVNQEMHLLFVDECDKCKDLIHVHSFAHDFHLRWVQNYLADQRTCEVQDTFKDTFNLDSFLTEFKIVYPYPPSFSRNCIQIDSIILPELPFPGVMLYDCMLKLVATKDVNCIYRMVGYMSETLGEKFAIVNLEKLDMSTQTYLTEEDPEVRPELYDAGLIVMDSTVRKDEINDAMRLVLKYFTLLTRKRDWYPMKTLEETLEKTYSKLSDAAAKESEATSCVKSEDPSDLSKPVAVRQHICMMKEHVNYRGYSNTQQLLLFTAMNGHSERGRAEILELIETSKRKCRRNFLWNRLLATRFRETPVDNKKRHSGDSEEDLEQDVAPLNTADFVELLDTVSMIPLDKIDPQLSPFYIMPYQWYHGLASSLMNKYRERYCTFFCPDKKTQYLVVFNANNLDMFFMLSLTDSTQKMELGVVTKETISLQIKQSSYIHNVPLYSLQAYVEEIINVCCYQVWASMTQ
ncbi:KICSTOR complex protein SZT2-like isoform X4 [Biomphalaria glabrata]|uniref:KICSTOR complex protein SZT2-like isoform X4 n=1 Tax=Biomphalaria glabrata TaxID=6526 RepID=A0A9W3AB56_BIOGL|nr:KICSTOR complex protein SZT2-like isoform X4 [Biomphalaria glabrata]